MAKIFPYLDRKFKFIWNLRTLKYLEDFLDLKSEEKEINVEYPIYES